MMLSSNNSKNDVSELLGKCRWSEEGSYLGEVTKSSTFPLLVKVLRGQYQNIGPSTNNNSHNVISHLLLVSAGRQKSIAAQCVKFKNSRQSRVVPFGPTLAIPEEFGGHFEILSEDGRAVPNLHTVDMLLAKMPDSCLVRETIKAYGSANDFGGCKSRGSVTELIIGDSLTPSVSNEKSRLVHPGEVLVLVGEVSVPSGKNKISKYLRCFDSNGQTLYLTSGQKGKFSPIAKYDSISGVHTTKNILSKRMPMMVRLVDGKAPVISSAVSKNTSFKFVPELRLFSTLHEEIIFGMPLSQSSKESLSILPLPLTVPLKFQVCKNMSQMELMKEFLRLHERTKTLVEDAKNLIQIYDINLKKEARFDGTNWKSYTPPIYLSSTQPLLSSPPPKNEWSSRESSPEYSQVPTDYEDIDEIYDYVRGVKGTAPKNVVVGPTTLITICNEEEGVKIVVGDRAPEPPPIETIPTHKFRSGGSNRVSISHYQPTERETPEPCRYQTQLGSNGSSPNNTSSTSAGSGGEIKMSRVKNKKNLYIKRQSFGSQTNLVIESSSSPLRTSVENNNSGSFFPKNLRRSPIFDCRYKSMNDLNNSLESCSKTKEEVRNSGRFFYNSSINNLNIAHGSRSRGLHRPKSLTNILGEDVVSTSPAALIQTPPPQQFLYQPIRSKIDLLSKFTRGSQGQARRKSQTPKLYL